MIGNRRWDFPDGAVEAAVDARPVRGARPVLGAAAGWRRRWPARTPGTIEVTLAVAQGADLLPAASSTRRTHLVQHLWMTTAAHFMQERYSTSTRRRR